MFVVIFRAQTRLLDEEYSALAVRLRDEALSRFGCVEFYSLCEGDEEIALSYWQSEQDILQWRQYSEHQYAQQRAYQTWYAAVRIEIAEITRRYEKAAG